MKNLELKLTAKVERNFSMTTITPMIGMGYDRDDKNLFFVIIWLSAGLSIEFGKTKHK